MSEHEKKVNRAKQAIQEVFTCTSVSPQKTIEALEDIISDVDGMIESIYTDLEGDIEEPETKKKKVDRESNHDY